MKDRFRARVTLEGAVAEVQLDKKLNEMEQSGTIFDYKRHDKDNYPDFSVWPYEGGPEQMIEVKNVRDAKDGYLKKGRYYAYKVEVQKTRAATSDASSRNYDVDQFDILAVCLGKKTGDWKNFLFVRTSDLARHSKYPNKLAANHKVPLPDGSSQPRLFGSNLRSGTTVLKTY